MQESETIQVLGRGTDVHFTIDDAVSFDVAERSLREYLDVCRGLYSSGTVSVNVGRRILQPDQLAAIKEILDQETGLTVTEYWCPKETLKRALAGPEAQKVLPCAPANATARPGPEASEILEVPEIEGPRIVAPAPARANEIDAPVSDSEATSGFQLALAFQGQDSFILTGQSEEAPHSQAPDSESVSSVEHLSQGTPQYLEQPLAVAESIETDLRESYRQGVDDAADSKTEEIPLEEIPAANSLLSLTELAADPDPGTSEPAPAGIPFLSPLSRADQALIIKNTCRSGEVIRYSGDVVVFGDVNPGAEIVADGDIIVLGTLRGMAHAGADGNLKSTIFAMNLESHRLQIGPHVGEAPRRSSRAKSVGRPVNPRIAYLRRRSVFVVPFTRRCEEYQGGILYEG